MYSPRAIEVCGFVHRNNGKVQKDWTERNVEMDSAVK